MNEQIVQPKPVSDVKGRFSIRSLFIASEEETVGNRDELGMDYGVVCR